MSITEENLKLNVGKHVSFRGQFGYLYTLCNATAGPCYCNNACGARLHLLAPDGFVSPVSDLERQRIRQLPLEQASRHYEAERERIESAPKIEVGLAVLNSDTLARRRPNDWPYVDHGGTLHCGGDEGTLCCPFRFEQHDQWSDVILTGMLARELQYPEPGWEIVYRIRMTSICSTE